jgi:hypothetical protein
VYAPAYTHTHTLSPRYFFLQTKRGRRVLHMPVECVDLQQRIARKRKHSHQTVKAFFGLPERKRRSTFQHADNTLLVFHNTPDMHFLSYLVGLVLMYFELFSALFGIYLRCTCVSHFAELNANIYIEKGRKMKTDELTSLS